MKKDKVIFRVTNVSEVVDGEARVTQVKMTGSNGTRLRFYSHPIFAWTLKAWVIGKISKKNLQYITYDWYVLTKEMKVKVGDTVSVEEKRNINGL